MRLCGLFCVNILIKCLLFDTLIQLFYRLDYAHKRSLRLMDLFIETLTGTAFELRVSPNDTVMSIKSKIQRVEGIPVAQQHLIWQNDELSDNQLLRDCNIPGGATLRLVLGMRGGPINTCRPPPIATAAAIRFTPTVRFATSNNPASATGGNLKKNRRDDALKNARLSASTASLQDLKEVIDSDSGEKKDLESEKRITFFIFNSRDSLDLLRVLDRYAMRTRFIIISQTSVSNAVFGVYVNLEDIEQMLATKIFVCANSSLILRSPTIYAFKTY